MADLKTITPEELAGNPFVKIGKEWMLVCAGKPDGPVNAMTASWGGLGVLWGKNVAYVVIRPQRYTKEFADASDGFSLSFFKGQKSMLSYMGSVSGRDEDKISRSGLTLVRKNGIPYFAEAQTVLLCKKLYAQPLRPEHFVARELDTEWYPQKDYHTLYVAEVEKVLVRE